MDKDKPKQPSPKSYQIHIEPELYLIEEPAAAYRSEYFDGKVIQMAGGSRAHNFISLNIITDLDRLFEDSDCHVFAMDLKVHSEMLNSYLYPDVAVVCDPLILSDLTSQIITNPNMVFEVLSPSTEKKDKGRKMVAYQSIPSLKAYFLIAQDKYKVSLYEKREDGVWIFSEYSDLNDEIPIAHLGITLKLSRVYRRINF